LGVWSAGEVGVVIMTRIRGSSNGKAKRQLGWRPRFASWREGFTASLAAAAVERHDRLAS
jgi:hypothetical protein